MNLTEIIECINGQIKQVFETYTGSVLYDGLAVNVPRGKDNMPAIVNRKGEAKYVGVDDLSPLTLYHKSSGIQISQQPSASFGDTLFWQVYTYQNVMIIFLDRKKACVMPDELVLQLQAHLLDKIKVPNYKSVIVKLGAVNLNSAQIFGQEYPGAENKMRLEQNIFQIAYTVEAVFDPNCLPKCS